MTKKKGLGRGLGALMEDLAPEPGPGEAPFEVPVEAIKTNPFQPRAKVSDQDVKALAESIRAQGLLAPLLVRREDAERYELIAGERRLRAAEAAGLSRVPVLVREASREQMLELALIENLHRQDLNPLEEGEAYHRLAEEFGRTQEEIARLTGRDRSTVANLMRLRSLPGPVQEDVRQGRLSAGHARAFLALESPKLILQARERVLRGALSVRQTEALVRRLAQGPRRPREDYTDQVYFQAMAEELTRRLGAKVRVVRRGKKGRLEIRFSSDEELERLLKFFGVNP